MLYCQWINDSLVNRFGIWHYRGWHSSERWGNMSCYRQTVLALSVSVVLAMENVLEAAQAVVGGMESAHTSEANLIGVGLAFFNVPNTGQIGG